MRYRITPRTYHHRVVVNSRPITMQLCFTTYVVQVRKWYGWITIKEYDNGRDSSFALRQAEELLKVLNQ